MRLGKAKRKREVEQREALLKAHYARVVFTEDAYSPAEVRYQGELEELDQGLDGELLFYQDEELTQELLGEIPTHASLLSSEEQVSHLRGREKTAQPMPITGG